MDEPAQPETNPKQMWDLEKYLENWFPSEPPYPIITIPAREMQRYGFFAPISPALIDDLPGFTTFIDKRLRAMLDDHDEKVEAQEIDRWGRPPEWPTGILGDTCGRLAGSAHRAAKKVDRFQQALEKLKAIPYPFDFIDPETVQRHRELVAGVGSYVWKDGKSTHFRNPRNIDLDASRDHYVELPKPLKTPTSLSKLTDGAFHYD